MGERETHLHQGNSGQAGCEKRGKSALARDFRTYAQSPYHCRAIQRATARGASPPRTPPSRHFRLSHQPHTALPSRHILQYMTGREMNRVLRQLSYDREVVPGHLHARRCEPPEFHCNTSQCPSFLPPTFRSRFCLFKTPIAYSIPRTERPKTLASSSCVARGFVASKSKIRSLVELFGFLSTVLSTVLTELLYVIPHHPSTLARIHTLQCIFAAVLVAWLSRPRHSCADMDIIANPRQNLAKMKRSRIAGIGLATKNRRCRSTSYLSCFSCTLWLKQNLRTVSRCIATQG